MSSSLDVSLDDLIKNNKKSASGGGFRGRGRGSGPGPSRSFPNRSGNRSNPYSTGRAMVPAPDAVWQHNMYADPMAAAPFAAAQAMSIETGTKLYISNLEYGVSNEDIKELFSEVGDLKRYSIHYDRSGRSKGTAEIVFSREGDALAAVKRYNNVQLDGKPMKIEIVGRNIVTPAPMPPSMFGRNGIPRSGPGRGGPMTRPQPMARPRGGGRGFGRGGRGRGRGGGRGGEKVSAEALDADLEKYHTESMQMN